MKKKRWLENNELFQEQLALGKKWEATVAKRLAEHGFDVSVPDCPFEGLETREEKLAIAHTAVDCFVGDLVIEVKSRNLKFTCSDDFPYATLVVDTVEGFDVKDPKPDVYICISQKTGDWTALDVKGTRGEWKESRKYDSVRRIPINIYECHKKHWGDPVTLLKALLPQSS